MGNGAYILAYDVGTTSMKTCLYEVGDKINLVSDESYAYPLNILKNGGAEQNPEDWWKAMCLTTKKIMEKINISPYLISGISFCSQMQGVVLVDNNGNPVRLAMSYMDQRGEKQLQKGLAHGIQIAGCNVFKLIKSLNITKAVAASVKDPVWKYKWVEDNEPENFKRVFKWLDVKEYLILKCTGQFVMTEDSAFATLLYDIRENGKCFSKEMCKMLGVNYDHLPKIIKSTEKVSNLTKDAAIQLGLVEGIAVFGGGGDASLIGVGAGATFLGSTHIYCGTSGWVSTIVDKPMVDTNVMIAAVVGADFGRYNYFAEMETAGKCLEWVKDHLALDEIDIYLEKKKVMDTKEAVFESLYDYMSYSIKDVPPGSNGVIFTPWLHGNRCPFEDPNAKGMFFNIGIETGKRDMIHSVIEGVCFHLRWMLESEDKKINTSENIRFVGGGALSSVTCQILSDVLGRKIETVHNAQNVGAVGAAIVAAVGIGIINKLENAKDIIEVSKVYEPNFENKGIYDRCFKVFKNLYKSNKENFSLMNKK